jgi:outer membrane protein assembly factor BamB
MKAVFSLVALGALLLTMTVPATAGENWSSFQNAGKVSMAADAAGLTLSEEIAWSVSIAGYGQSSPVVWDGRVYVTSVEGPNKETYHVTAYGLRDGTELWQYDVANASPRENNNYVSKAAPTPAADADGLLCFFEGGNLVALTHDGRLRWERNLVDEYGDIGARHGLAASVEQDDDSAYVWVERPEQPYVLSVNKETGETNWKVDGVGATSWASPRLVPAGESRHLVLSAIGSLVGLDPASGETLWRLDGITGNSTPTPIPLGKGRFLIGATVGREEADTSGAAASNGVVAIGRTDTGSWQADYVWRAERATSSFGSPIAHGGTACFVNRTGVVYGLDVETGEERFARRLAGSTWATPLGEGERVYFFGRDGRVNVLSGGGESPDIALWDALPADPGAGGTLYAAAWCDGFVLLRRGDRLFAVRTTDGMR